jgi:hypothetical protein
MDRSAPRVATHGGAAVHGNLHVARDFIGRDQHKHYYVSQVTPIFMPRTGGPAERRQPYLGGQPFRADDWELLTGRGEAVGDVIRQIQDRATLATAVYGPPDVGKTSFLAAGVLPRLDGAGSDVFPLRDYGDAVSLIKGLLLGRARAMALDVSDGASVPELVQAVVAASPRRMVWLFDQFERFFLEDVSAEEREALQETLVNTVQQMAPDRFQILIGIRDDWQSAFDRQWGDLLPGLRELPVHLEPLKLSQAKVAILHPTRELRVQPIFDESFLDAQLLDDLERLSLDQPERILPADLQIVCRYLYEAARERREQSIRAALYFEVTEGKGAEWILDDHLRGLLERVEGVGRGRVEEVAAEMLALEPGVWANPDRLPVRAASPAEVAAALEAMARAGLTVWHLADERRIYAFASNSIARAAERALGPQAQRRLRARRELDYVWRDWLADDAWASRYQLNLVDDHYDGRPLPAERALVALRSAVARQMPVRPWLKRLEGEAAHRLIQELEETEGAISERAEGLTRRRQAARILGVADQELPPRPRSDAFGPLSWIAAVHRAPESREAAALAALSAYGQGALERLRDAVEAAREADVLGTGPAWRRLAELRGILADARDEIAKEVRTYGWREQLGVWWWRFRRRVGRDRRYILRLSAGGGVGAGLGLGALRFLMAPLVGGNRGFMLYSTFPSGFLLGWALSLGLVLVDAVRLRPRERRREEAGARLSLPAVVQGALAFAAAYVLLIVLLDATKLTASPLGPPLALVAGVGLSYAVRDQPVAGWRIGIGGWVRRLAASALAFALGQLAFVAVDAALGPGRDLGTGLTVVWSGSTYESFLSALPPAWGLGRLLSSDRWYHFLAMADAALVGVVLALGLSAGLIVARRRHRRWESLIRRAGE